MDPEERGRYSQINASFDLSHPKISSQEGGWCVPDYAGEMNDISTEAYKEGEVLNSESLNEIMDTSFEINQDGGLSKFS